MVLQTHNADWTMSVLQIIFPLLLLNFQQQKFEDPSYVYTGTWVTPEDCDGLFGFMKGAFSQCGPRTMQLSR